MEGEYLLSILQNESTAVKPSSEVCIKIKNLSGLLELQGTTPNWRFVENAKPEVQIYNRSNKPYDSLSKSGSPSFRSMSRVPSNDSIAKTRTPTSSPRYVSKFRNSEKEVNDKILNTIILSKLNKFSESTYNEIRDFLYQILGSTGNDFSNEDFIKEFMNLVFEKAVREEIFCPLYAKLLFEISEKHPIILNEMNKLHENYLEIFKECDQEISTDYTMFLKKNSEKKYRLGYSQFLAELTTLRILSSEKIIDTFKVIFEQIELKGKLTEKISLNEEYVNCLLRITKVLQKRTELFFIQLRKSLLPIVLESKTKIDQNKSSYISISSKSRFLLMDIYDFIKE
jgi:hypothetical protein